MCLLFVNDAATTTKLVWYYTHQSRYRPGVGRFLPENVDPHLCTHLVYTYAILSTGNGISQSEWSESSYSTFNQLKDRCWRKRCRIKGSTGFSQH